MHAPLGQAKEEEENNSKGEREGKAGRGRGSDSGERLEWQGLLPLLAWLGCVFEAV